MNTCELTSEDQWEKVSERMNVCVSESEQGVDEWLR